MRDRPDAKSVQIGAPSKSVRQAPAESPPIALEEPTGIARNAPPPEVQNGASAGAVPMTPPLGWCL